MYRQRRFFPLLNAHRMLIYSLVGHGKSVSKNDRIIWWILQLIVFDITEKKNRKIMVRSHKIFS